jgi:excisionase family DNA binding protein
MMETIDGAYTLKDFCATYGVGMTFTYEQINSGRLQAVKLGRHTRIPRDAAREWFKSLPAFTEKRPSAA